MQLSRPSTEPQPWERGLRKDRTPQTPRAHDVPREVGRDRKVPSIAGDSSAAMAPVPMVGRGGIWGKTMGKRS